MSFQWCNSMQGVDIGSDLFQQFCHANQDVHLVISAMSATLDIAMSIDNIGATLNYIFKTFQTQAFTFRLREGVRHIMAQVAHTNCKPMYLSNKYINFRLAYGYHRVSQVFSSI